MQPADGTIRAWLDGELLPEEGRAVEEYLAANPEARMRADQLRARGERVREILLPLAPEGRPADAPEAWAAFQQEAQRRTAWTAPAKRSRRLFPHAAWGALAAAVLLAALLLTSSSARAAAQRLLGFLRLKNVAVITIDPSMLHQGMTENRGKMFADLLSQSVTETKKAGKEQMAKTAAEASDLAGFGVRLPQAQLDAPVLKVRDSSAFQVKLDRARVRNFVELAGRQDIELPEALDGATVAVDIPKSVQAVYGTCPEHRGSDESKNKSRPDWSNCHVLMQIPTPTVVTVPEFDLGKLAEVGLQVAGMTADEAQAIRNRIDWTSSLVIPIPAGNVSHQEVSVDGVRGVLVSELHSNKSLPGYAIVWIRNGVTYALRGFGSGLAGLPIADSLQ